MLTAVPVPCRAEEYDGIRGADFLARYARSEMAGDASLTEANRDTITALMVIQFNYFFFNRRWKIVSTLENDPTAPYPADAPQLPLQIARELIAAYCGNGENIAATFNGRLSPAVYAEIQAAGLFQNEEAVFEISFHPDHIQAVETMPLHQMVAFQISATRAVAIGTTSEIRLDYQCPAGIINYVQRDPNRNGGLLDWIGSAECISPSECPDNDYWVITEYNSEGQGVRAVLFEDRPSDDREWFFNCDLSAPKSIT
jgi:hypothetical protein